MVDLAFYIFSVFLVFAGACVVFSRNTVHAVLFLILAFFNAAALFILLGAEFLAMMLVIVYVGAVAVLFLFVVMMLNIKPMVQPLWFTRERWHIFVQSLGHFINHLFCCSVATFALYRLLGIIVFFIAYGMTNTISASYDIIGDAGIVDNYIPIVFARSTSDLPITDTMRILSGLTLLLSLIMAKLLIAKQLKRSLWTTCVQLYRSLPVPVLIGSILFVEMIIMLSYWNNHSPSLTVATEILQIQQSTQSLPNTHALGLLLFKNYVFEFIMAGIILLVAMIGAIVLTLQRHTLGKRQDIAKQLARRKEDTLTLCKVRTGEGIL